MASIKLPFGRKRDAILHISQVRSGLACDCVCPSCGKPLIARKGAVKVHHFAHDRGAECPRSVETALHLAAKAILAERREISLPAIHIVFNSYRAPIVVTPERSFALDHVREEHRSGDVVPDLLAFVGTTPLMIEIRVTHAVDEIKLRKIRTLGISTIEIDLSAACRDFSPDDLADAVTHRTANKKWLFNARAERLKALLLQTGERKPTFQRRVALHVQGCPIDARVWRDKSYANVIDDCVHCPFALELGENLDFVRCGGRHKIGTLDELNAYYQRIKGPAAR